MYDSDSTLANEGWQGNQPMPQGDWQQGSGTGWAGTAQPQYQQAQQGFDMPQPTYAYGMPQPIKPPRTGPGAVSAWASRSLRKGIGSILWATLGLLAFGIGPIVGFFMGLSAIIKGIGELVRAQFLEGFGRVAAIFGILLGIVGMGLGGFECLFAFRTVQAIAENIDSGMELCLESPDDLWALLAGNPRLRESEDYDAYEGDLDTSKLGSDSLGWVDAQEQMTYRLSTDGSTVTVIDTSNGEQREGTYYVYTGGIAEVDMDDVARQSLSDAISQHGSWRQENIVQVKITFPPTESDATSRITSPMVLSGYYDDDSDTLWLLGAEGALRALARG